MMQCCAVPSLFYTHECQLGALYGEPQSLCEAALCWPTRLPGSATSKGRGVARRIAMSLMWPMSHATDVAAVAQRCAAATDVR